MAKPKLSRVKERTLVQLLADHMLSGTEISLEAAMKQGALHTLVRSLTQRMKSYDERIKQAVQDLESAGFSQLAQEVRGIQIIGNDLMAMTPLLLGVTARLSGEVRKLQSQQSSVKKPPQAAEDPKAPSRAHKNRKS